MNDFWLFQAPSIGDIKEVVERAQKKRPREGKAVVKSGRGCGRHVKWNPGQEYVCVREGVEMESELDLDHLYKTKQLKESLFYIFKNVDKNVERNEDVPLYEAVYSCAGRYYVVQKRHLKQAYANSKRNDIKQMWTILEDGVPYYVDRYAYCRQSQLESKKRYENKRVSK